jgi:hypothetical protein
VSPATGAEDPLRHLSPLERDCLLRYCALPRVAAVFEENLARDGVELAV